MQRFDVSEQLLPRASQSMLWQAKKSSHKGC